MPQELKSRGPKRPGDASLSADRRPFQTNKRCQSDLGRAIEVVFLFYLPFKRGAAGQLRVKS